MWSPSPERTERGDWRPLVRTMRLGAVIACGAVLWPGPAPAEPVAVRHTEGIVHGFLVLRTLEGRALADGDLIQSARGNRVTTRLVFSFKDGSIHDETAVYSQSQRFQLVSDHLVQKGPTFPQPLDMLIDGVTGRRTGRAVCDDRQVFVGFDGDDVHGSHATRHRLRMERGAPPYLLGLLS